MKKQTKTAAKRIAGPRRRPGAAIVTEPQVEGEKTNKPFAERFQEGRLSTAEILGENVKRLRKRLDLSQADLARAIGTDQSAIGLIETRRANPTVRTVEKLAAVLKTTVVDLLSRPGRRRTHS
ncbi:MULTISPECIES: helix-turn-helix transcriptional regulator [unclassified Bradyrhizobium]|uniref:helix-turn-helix transcriptional regulator n=1 Tax=unclassified Bradyrhizobium TaxID=2631580 RepID=UPI001FF7A524|nr:MULTISPECIES: helix-turn-helix transcriptional regulator [unclassified Bradyrhizobium]MCK1294518.1 helix-turn-helix transcriptional regulator [Bradyrhizobium sp. 30]MCK1305337.1 helix-turn-helix transcriptional regulator [Bradyrhizobium sp. 45]MCK1318373.1 helix-turn-helix transcriptional regulator [Bradyrhizobium sp. 23]MCK1439950.1 helix-turn-helix transcriptional regulator [Bradyrhizobium sp. 15]MCK1508024.1 helix-turn-helix transcriptional regulator [Bradyrhizobium sp. 18]